MLRKRISEERFQKIHRSFEEHEFWALMFPAMLPPPLPFKIFVLGAAVSEMRFRDFLVAIFLGRCVRFGVLSILVLWFGPAIVGLLGILLKQHWAGLVVGLLVAAICLWFVLRWKRAIPSDGNQNSGVRFRDHSFRIAVSEWQVLRPCCALAGCREFRQGPSEYSNDQKLIADLLCPDRLARKSQNLIVVAAPTSKSAVAVRGPRGCMRRPVLLLAIAFVSFLACSAALAASGPKTAWNVFTLPNPHVTPNWRAYAPADCQSVSRRLRPGSSLLGMSGTSTISRRLSTIRLRQFILSENIRE